MTTTPKNPEPTEQHRDPSTTPSPAPAPARDASEAALRAWGDVDSATLKRLGIVADGSILLALLLVVLAAFGARAQEVPTPEPVPPYSYRFTVADRLLAAQACTHEATWAGAERTGDCGGILQVVMERRTRGESFERALERTMPRFYAGATSRAWTRHLPSGPLRVNPEGWPYDYPARVHDETWLAVNTRIQNYMRGVEPLPCEPTPRRWFGRTTDGTVLASTLAAGRWCEAACGESRNAFLARCSAEGDGPSTAGSPSLALEVDPE